MVVSKDFPRFGLGMAALGRPGYITLNRSSIFGTDERTVDFMQKTSNDVMDELFRLASGFSSNNHNYYYNNMKPWLDCARSYGLSEKFVGEYLKKNNIPTDAVFVSSKWGYTYVADFQVSLSGGDPHEVKDHSTENFVKQVQETIHYLGDYVNLYQIHSATFESGIMTDTIAHEALMKCKKERGWSIGLSVSSPKQHEIIREAMKISVRDEKLFDSVQCTYNVLEQRPAAALQDAHDAGMEIIVKEGLANGRVLQNTIIIDYAKKLQCEPDQLALGCILAQSFQPHVLSGAVTPSQLASNWKALDIADKLKTSNQALLQEIMSACKVDSEDYWTARAELAWN